MEKVTYPVITKRAGAFFFVLLLIIKMISFSWIRNIIIIVACILGCTAAYKYITRSKSPQDEGNKDAPTKTGNSSSHRITTESSEIHDDLDPTTEDTENEPPTKSEEGNDVGNEKVVTTGDLPQNEKTGESNDVEDTKTDTWTISNHKMHTIYGVYSMHTLNKYFQDGNIVTGGCSAMFERDGFVIVSSIDTSSVFMGWLLVDLNDYNTTSPIGTRSATINGRHVPQEGPVVQHYSRDSNVVMTKPFVIKLQLTGSTGDINTDSTLVEHLGRGRGVWTSSGWDDSLPFESYKTQGSWDVWMSYNTQFNSWEVRTDKSLGWRLWKAGYTTFLNRRLPLRNVPSPDNELQQDTKGTEGTTISYAFPFLKCSYKHIWYECGMNNAHLSGSLLSTGGNHAIFYNTELNQVIAYDGSVWNMAVLASSIEPSVLVNGSVSIVSSTTIGSLTKTVSGINGPSVVTYAF